MLDGLLTRPQAGPPVDKASARIAARTRVAAAAYRPSPAGVEAAPVIPMEIFDARAEAERWLGRVPRPRAGRDRPHLFPGRPRAVNGRFTDDEYDELTVAADNAGLTPTGFCAQAVLDAARDLRANTVERMEREALGNLQAELLQTRVALNQFRAELGHTRNDSRATTDDLVVLR